MVKQNNFAMSRLTTKNNSSSPVWVKGKGSSRRRIYCQNIKRGLQNVIFEFRVNFFKYNPLLHVPVSQCSNFMIYLLSRGRKRRMNKNKVKVNKYVFECRFPFLKSSNPTSKVFVKVNIANCMGMFAEGKAMSSTVDEHK